MSSETTPQTPDRQGLRPALSLEELLVLLVQRNLASEHPAVESGGLPFRTVRPTHRKRIDGSGMLCGFRALQLQRADSRMS